MSTGSRDSSLLQGSRKRWPLNRVYYALAAIDIVTVAAAVVIGHMTMGIVRGFVEDNHFWADRVATLTMLQSMAGRVNAPGNDVFQSHNVQREQLRRDDAIHEFLTTLRQFTDGLDERLPPAYSDRIAAGIQVIADDLARMVVISDVVFRKYGAGDVKGATIAMAEMDQVLGDMTTEIGALSRVVQSVQNRTFEEQLAYAADIQDFKNLYIGIVLLMVGFAILYGNRIARAFREADAERHRFLAGLDGISAGFVHFGPDGRIVSCNRRYQEIYSFGTGFIRPGVTLEEILRYEAGKGAFGDDPEAIERAIAARLAYHANPADKPFEESHVDGKWVLCFDAKTPDGGTVGIRMDVSYLKKTESALRTAMTEAENANKAKSQFLANMSHEIRTPMNGVIGMAELLARTALNDHQRKLVGTIRRSGQTLLEIINDVLDFSRIEAGRFELERIAFSIGEAVEDNVELLSEAAARKGLSFTCHIAETVPARVWGDLVRFKQVVVNLLSNAIKFTDRGAVRIDVSASPEWEGRVSVTVTVQDTGIGMGAEVRSKLFSPFEQADGSITRRFGGTGLGLSISQRIIAKMGGRIDIESEVGRGSTFRFTVSFDIAPPEEASAAPAQSLGARRALVVVENGDNREILCQYLGSWGIEAISASAASDAVERLDRSVRENTPFDLILADLDGALDSNAARRICAHPASSKAHVVGVTSSQSAVEPDSSGHSGIASLIGMPVRRSTLLNEIMRLFAGRTVGEPRRAHESQGATVSDRVGRTVHVLVAEDNPVNQQVTAGLLESLGCTVTVAATGREAVEAVERGTFDIVFMDCQMPEMDGMQATEAIRERERGASGRGRLPIVALTAHAFEDDRSRCLAAGMDDFASKPVAAEVLEALLLRWVQSASPAVTDTPPYPPMAKAELAEGKTARDDLRQKLGPVVLKRVVDIYLKAAPSDLSALGKAIADRDAETARKKAHSLKSGSANLGANGLASLLRDIEIGAADGRIGDAAAAFAKIEREFEKVRSELESER
ncbi:MAG: response regulator [Alphaproteobacteria bacterium]